MSFRTGRGDRVSARRRGCIARPRQRNRPQLGAGIVERENLLHAHAVVPRHGLRAPRTHADAVAEAPEVDAKAVALVRHLHGLVGCGVDGQAVPVLQAAVGGHVHRGREGHGRAVGQPLRLHPQLKGQRAVQAAGRGVLGILRRDALDGADFHVRRVPTEPLPLQHILHALQQRLLQRGLQAACVLRYARGVLLRGGIPQIVGIVLDHAVAQHAAPDVLRGLRLTAVGGGVVAARQRPAAVEYLPGGLLHRLNHTGLAGVEAAKDLIGGGVHHVVAPGGLGGQLLQRVVARRHRLHLQRLQRVGVGHLVAHHAAEVVLHRQVQHRRDRGAAGAEIEVAAECVRQRRRLEAHAAASAAQQPRTGAAAELHAAAGQRQRTAIGAQRDAAARGDVQREIARAEVVAVHRENQLRGRAQPRELHPHQSARLRAHRRKLRPRKQQNQRQQRAQRPAHKTIPPPRHQGPLSPLPPYCDRYLVSIIHDPAAFRQFSAGMSHSSALFDKLRHTSFLSLIYCFS